MRTKYYKFGLVGFPVSYSLSPYIHRAALESVGLEGEYNLISTRPEEFETTLENLCNEGYAGFNVSIPYRVNITYMLPEVKELVSYSGAVSTVKILKKGAMVGYNTDVYGFATSLPCEVCGKTAAVLGTGGAARAVCLALIKMGVVRIYVYSRDTAKADGLFMLMQARFNHVELHLCSYCETERLADVCILVNTSPVGLKDYPPCACLLQDKDLKKLPADAVVYDVIYNPEETELLKKAKKIGFKTQNGLDMLVRQAAKSFNIWTDKEPDIEHMKRAATEALAA